MYKFGILYYSQAVVLLPLKNTDNFEVGFPELNSSYTVAKTEKIF